MSDGKQYDADYFLRGKETGKSLYSDYRWLPDLTIPMACAMIRHLGLQPYDRILDFGCARGYTVRALREMNYNAWGYDISQWALENADPAVKEYLVRSDSEPLMSTFDWVIAKDVLEHVAGLQETIEWLMCVATRGLFIVVPLSDVNGCQYVVADYEKDVTHLWRFTLAGWFRLLARPGWTVEASYRVNGVKDNYAGHQKGNGFFTLRRIEG